MSTYYDCRKSTIHIPIEKMPEAIRLLREYAEQCYPRLTSIQDADQFVRAVASRESWHTGIEEDGEIRQVGFDESCPHYGWLDAIASCIQSGSYVEVQEDQYYRVVWLNGQTHRKVYPLWPSDLEIAQDPTERELELELRNEEEERKWL